MGILRGRRLPFVAQVLQNWWLSVWARQTQAAGDHLSPTGLHFYLGVYSAIGLTALASQAVRGVFLLFGMLNASEALQANLVSNVSSVRVLAGCIKAQASSVRHELAFAALAACERHDVMLNNTASSHCFIR